MALCERCKITEAEPDGILCLACFGDLLKKIPVVGEQPPLKTNGLTRGKVMHEFFSISTSRPCNGTPL